MTFAHQSWIVRVQEAVHCKLGLHEVSVCSATETTIMADLDLRQVGQAVVHFTAMSCIFMSIE